MAQISKVKELENRIKLLDFTSLSKEDLRLVLNWRNDSQVRKWMLTQTKISFDSHLGFVEKLKTDSTKKYFCVCSGERKVGVIDFYQINKTNSSCYYGYYLNPELIGSSMGILLEFLVAEYAFSELKLKTLIAETMVENKKAIALHESFGFENGSMNRNGLLESTLEAHDWELTRSRFLPIVLRLI